MQIARRQLGFFKHVSNLLETGTIKLGNVKAVNEAVTLAEQGKVHSAEVKLRAAGF